MNYLRDKICPGLQKKEQVGKKGLNIILEGGVAGGHLWELGPSFTGKCPHTVGVSWKAPWPESSLCGLILRNQADVCFGDVNVFLSALFSKINRKDVRSCLLDLEHSLLAGPRASMTIATLSTSLMDKDVYFGDIF